MISSLSHQWILCSEWVPSEWESKQLIKHHNNPQVIHTTPVHQLTSGEDKSWNKFSIKTFLTQIRVHNNASLQWKSASPVVSHIKIQPHICLQLFCLVNAAWSVQIYLLTQTRTLFHWRKHYYWLWSHILVTNVLTMDLFQLLSSPDVNWWTGVVWITCGLLWCFYQLFGVSFWRHPFTAEHPFLRHFSKSDEETNSS